MKGEKILHMFEWRLKDITNVLDDVKNQGFTMIQVSPLQETKEEDNFQWWMLYQNINFKVGNRIGSKDDLIELCKKAHEKGLKIIVDVALHNVGSDNQDNSIPHEKVPEYIKKHVLKVETCKDYEDRYQTTHLQVGLPLVDYDNYFIQFLHKLYLIELAGCGVDGFRWDMAKHFSLPEEGYDYFTNVLEGFEDKIIYGEILDSATHVLDMYTKHMDIVSNKEPTDKTKLVTFFESHDTFHTWGTTKGMTFDHMLYEWDNIINNRKLNGIFFTRPFDDMWKSEQIKQINNK